MGFSKNHKVLDMLCSYANTSHRNALDAITWTTKRMIVLLTILILCIPTVSEIIDDRNGETSEQKKKDVFVRAMLMMVSAGVATAIVQTSLNLWPLVITYFKCWFLSFAIFFLFFDYLINLILGRKPWYSYLSKSPLDKLWSGWDWMFRMGIRIAVFIAALLFYF